MVKIILIIVLVIILLLSGALYILYVLFSEKEKYFKKNLQKGDMCLFYPSEYEDKLCEVLEINENVVKIKDMSGEIYVTNIENITSPLNERKYI